MRNGLNVAFVSEFVHEIRERPEEALVCLESEAQALAPGLSQVRTCTLTGGTVRVARDFPLLVSDPHVPGRLAASTHELLALSLGGCVLATFVQGVSARGISLVGASVDVRAAFDVDATGSPKVGSIEYTYDIDCDGDHETLLDIAKYVSCLSPNHRAFIEPGELSVSVESEGTVRDVLRSAESGSSAQSTSNANGTPGVRAMLDWHYGTQLRSSLQTSGETHTPFCLPVDQPKQYLGLDSAANPQEYLLAALSSELIANLRHEFEEAGVPLGLAKVRSAGWLDMRGITNVDDRVPVKFHNIDQRFQYSAPLSLMDSMGLVERATRRCVSHAVLRRPLDIDVTVKSRGELVSSFRSNLEMLADYLQELARRKAEAERSKH